MKTAIDIVKSGEMWSMTVATVAKSIVDIGVSAGKSTADATALLDNTSAAIVANKGPGSAYFTLGKPIAGGPETNPREVIQRGGVVRDLPADTPTEDHSLPLSAGAMLQINGYDDLNRFRIVSDATAKISVQLLGG